MKNAYDYFLEYTDKSLFYTEKSVEWNLTIDQLKELLTIQVIKKRQTEYPDYREFLDAWVKRDDIALEAYRQKCLSVKSQYPKPE